MALRRPTVRSRSAPQNHFGFFGTSDAREGLGNDSGTIGGVEGVIEGVIYDASFPPLRTPSTLFCWAPATASRFA
jgi:hypothetical protein